LPEGAEPDGGERFVLDGSGKAAEECRIGEMTGRRLLRRFIM